MIKKLLSIFVIVLLTTNSSFAIDYGNNSINNTSFGSNNLDSITAINKEMILSKLKIKKDKNGFSYIIKLIKIEKFIDGQKDIETIKKLKEINFKRLVNSTGLVGSNGINNEIYNYIDLKFKKRILELEQESAQNLILSINNPSLPKDEIKKVEDEIVKLQMVMLDNSKTLLEKILQEINDNINYEDNGNFKFDVEGNYTNYGSGKAYLNMKNIKSNSSNFDSELSTQIDLLIQASMKGEKEFKTQLSTLLNVISKDGNIYLLLDKLNYSGDSLDYSGTSDGYLSKLKELSAKGEYLKIDKSDVNNNKSQNIINFYKNFDLNNSYNESKKLLSEPMFKVYKKDGNKYLLVPSKKACDSIKAISYKINGNGNWYCSDNEYIEMLNNISKSGNFYITLGNTYNTVGFDLENDNSTKLSIKIDYTNKKITKLNVDASPKDEKFKGEFFKLDFVNGSNLNIEFDANKSNKLYFSFKSILDETNFPTKIDYIGSFGKEFKSNFKLENNSFSGSFENKASGYENKTYQYVEGLYSYKGNINGTIKDKLVDFISINILGKNTKTNKTNLEVVGKLENKIISSLIKFNGDNEEFIINSDGTYNSDNFELNNKILFSNPTNKNEKINSNLNLKIKGNAYDYNSSIYFDLFLNKIDYLKANIMIDNIRKKTEAKTIKVPTKYKTINEVFNKNENIK